MHEAKKEKKGFAYFNSFVKETIHNPDKMVKRKPLENPPDPVHIDTFSPGTIAVPLQMHGGAFLKQNKHNCFQNNTKC